MITLYDVPSLQLYGQQERLGPMIYTSKDLYGPGLALDIRTLVQRNASTKSKDELPMLSRGQYVIAYLSHGACTSINRHITAAIPMTTPAPFPLCPRSGPLKALGMHVYSEASRVSRSAIGEIVSRD